MTNTIDPVSYNAGIEAALAELAPVAKAILAEAPDDAAHFRVFKDRTGRVWCVSLKSLRAIFDAASHYRTKPQTAPIMITAWFPTPDEILALMGGGSGPR